MSDLRFTIALFVFLLIFLLFLLLLIFLLSVFFVHHLLNLRSISLSKVVKLVLTNLLRLLSFSKLIAVQLILSTVYLSELFASFL